MKQLPRENLIPIDVQKVVVSRYSLNYYSFTFSKSEKARKLNSQRDFTTPCIQPKQNGVSIPKLPPGGAYIHPSRNFFFFCHVPHDSFP
ncbi:hypothetical protein V6N13_117401 [Hibiscus sabdariffa]